MKDTNRKTFWKGAAAGAFLTVLSMVIFSGVNDLRDTTGILKLWKIKENISIIQKIIEDQYLFDEDAEMVEYGIYKGMVEGLGDPYAYYYTPAEYTYQTDSSDGFYVGIGAEWYLDEESGRFCVSRVFKGSPACEAEMEVGDVFYAVNGEQLLEDIYSEEVAKLIWGEEGTILNVTVLRDGKLIEMNIERRRAEIQTVEYELLADQTGYLSVMEFDRVTVRRFKEAIEDMEKRGMKRLVIDLRGNPGGLLEGTVEMAAYILPEDQMNGLLVYTKDKYGKGERYFSRDGKLQFETDLENSENPDYPIEDGHQLDLPVAILINEDSASASELFAGALRDYDRAVLVGTRSFGKGIVQQLTGFTDGSGIKLTVAYYYTPGGYCVHEQGLEPDVEVEFDRKLYGKDYSLETDSQFKAAVHTLESEYCIYKVR